MRNVSDRLVMRVAFFEIIVITYRLQMCIYERKTTCTIYRCIDRHLYLPYRIIQYFLIYHLLKTRDIVHEWSFIIYLHTLIFDSLIKRFVCFSRDVCIISCFVCFLWIIYPITFFLVGFCECEYDCIIYISGRSS